MTFSSDRIESKSNFSKTASWTMLSAIILLILFLLTQSSTRGPALVGLALLISIMLHEAGHFIAAKWSKMKATEFFVGFGPRIWSFKKGETEYGIKAIPLGGYVKIIGMTQGEEVPEADEPRTFRQGKTLNKLIVILAGITMNLLLAFMSFYVFFAFHGVATESNIPKIGSIALDSGAADAQLQTGDVLTKIGTSQITTFEDVRTAVSKHNIGDKIPVTVKRDNKLVVSEVVLKAGIDDEGKTTNKPVLGITQEATYNKLGLIESGKQSFTKIWYVTEVSAARMKELVSPSGISDYSKTVVEGDYENQSRPQSVVGIVDTGGQIVNQDGWSLLGLIAVVNVFLAILNLVPILPLDGGHVPIILYEYTASKIKKRDVRVDHRKLVPIMAAFLVFMALLSLSTIWLDIKKIVS